MFGINNAFILAANHLLKSVTRQYNPQISKVVEKEPVNTILKVIFLLLFLLFILPLCIVLLIYFASMF